MSETNAFTAPINSDAQRLSEQPPKTVSRVEGVKPTKPTNQADMSPQQRWQLTQDDRARNDPWIDQRHVLVDEPDGRRVQRERIVDQKTGEVRAGKIIADETGQPIEGEHDAAGKVAAEGDDEKFKFGDFELSAKEIRELAAHKAAEDSRKALIPANAQDYRLELPKDLKLPPGVTFEFNPKDPIKGPGLEMARNFAKAHGMSQAAFSEMMGVYAASTANEQIMIGQAAERERAALGATGPARVDAIVRWLRAQFGNTAAQPFVATLVKASMVDSWESVITKMTNQGGGAFSRRGNEPEQLGISDEAYAAMSYGEKLTYARNASARAQSSGRR